MHLERKINKCPIFQVTIMPADSHQTPSLYHCIQNHSGQSKICMTQSSLMLLGSDYVTGPGLSKAKHQISFVEIIVKNCQCSLQSSAADVHWQYFSFVFGIPQSSHVSWQWQLKLDLIFLETMTCSQQYSIGLWHRSLFPSVYYCNIWGFQSWVTSPIYMTSISSMLTVFASKIKEILQIRIKVSHVQGVPTLVEFG